ncbi:hypothetical protein [Gardnerella pickettii]|uniref:Uncharacterized protein n=1 Tax=Gardnerella pickettii JCP8017A TaxID=1261062 RepID=T2PPP0_9BIFI|nr:hypothetical protein [Gardnerella pickettii]EPI53514.1 hypothetical protein HMPREF1577_00093 [Gardnerella pickettii JCP8017A]EPI62342.1 hypothetical protein HMPREF1578_00066 [Gardnerella pickettii JCP8017B]
MSFDNLGDAATWFSAGVAVVSAIFTVWWPWHNRPQACLVSMPFDSFDAFAAVLPEFRGLEMMYTRGQPDYAVKLTNSGDCVAFDVSLSAIDCDVFIVEPVEGVVEGRGSRKILLPESLASISCGESVLVVAYRHKNAQRSGFRVRWMARPVRCHKYVSQLIELEGKFDLQPYNPIPEKRSYHPFVWFYRLTHWRES